MKFEVKIPEKIPAYLILILFPNFMEGLFLHLRKKKKSSFIGVHSGIHGVTYLIKTAALILCSEWKEGWFASILICGIETLLVDFISSLKILGAHGEIIN